MNCIDITLIAKHYVRAVKNAGIPVIAAYVIGSQVTGTAHEGSDIDICIVSPMFGKNRHAEALMHANTHPLYAFTYSPDFISGAA